MQTYLIISLNPSFIESSIANFKKKLSINEFTTHELLPSPSIGINDVRSLKQLLALKPYGGKNRLIIIKETEKTTIPAQNALLKILEEPPVNTSIVLVCQTKELLLETIVSRCQVITDKDRIIPNHKNSSKVRTILEKIVSSSPGTRIIISQQFSKTKEDTLLFLTELISILETYLASTSSLKDLSKVEIGSMITKSIAAKRSVEGNINYKGILDVLLLGFPMGN